MAVQHQRLVGDMSEARRPQIDRAYTISRVEWMLENYHALLSRKPMDLEKDVKPGVTTQHTQWWQAQSYWRKADKKSDLDKQIDAFQERGNHRAWLLLHLRYRSEPFDRPTWEEIAATLAISRMQVNRIHNWAVGEIAWNLGGIRDE